MVDKDKDIESPRGGTALKLDKGNVAESWIYWVDGNTDFALCVALCDEHDQIMIAKQAKGLKQVIVCDMRQEFKCKNLLSKYWKV